MRSSRAVALATVWAVHGVVLPSPGLGRERPCALLVVEADTVVRARWPELPVRVRSALARRADIDRCARVRLTTSEGAINLEVILDDGRSALRRVSAQEDVIPTLEALLIVPPRKPTMPAAEPDAIVAGRVDAETPGAQRNASPGAPTLRSPRTGVAERERPAQLASELTNPTRLTLSLVGGARVGDEHTSENFGVISLMAVSNWLLGFEGRVANYEAIVSNVEPMPQTTLEFAALGGRRLGSGTVALDLILGPALVLQRASDVEVDEPAGTTRRSTSSRILPRLCLGSHLHVGARSVVAGFIGIEGAIAAPGASRTDGPDAELSRLPTWMLGLALGATVKLQ